MNYIYENVKLKEINEYKSRLLCSVSHELRTPLNGNLNYLETLLETNGIVSEYVKEAYIKPALACSKLLYYQINDIIDFTSINESELKL